MTTYMLTVEETSQTFPVPADIGADDAGIRRALASVVPYIDTATLKREEKDGVMTITVEKTHAPKGAGSAGSSPLGTDSASVTSVVMRRLAESDEAGAMNPSIELFEQIERRPGMTELKPHEVLDLDKQIAVALQQSDQRHDTLVKVYRALTESPICPARHVPVGF
jgi:hypothetical protein